MSFPNLPPALSDLLDSGLTTLTLRRLAEREREVAAELLRQQRDQERVCVILNAARSVLPEALTGYLAFPERDPNDQNTWVEIHVPGCAPVRLQVPMAWGGGDLLTREPRDHWRPCFGPVAADLRLLSVPTVIAG